MSRRPRRRLVIAGAATAALLGGATAAWAAPPTVTPGTLSYWKDNATFTITGSAPDEALSYEVPGATPPQLLPPGGGPVTLGPGYPEGNWTLTARVEGGAETDVTSVPFIVDRTPPTVTGIFNPPSPNGENGWYRSLDIIPQCEDPLAGIVPGSCTATDPISSSSPEQRVQLSAQDNAGNRTDVQSAPFKFDNEPPLESGGQPMSPVSASVVPEPPEFTWDRGEDRHSGVDHYELQVKRPSSADWDTVATVPDTGALRYAATSSEPMPVNQLFRWRVVTVDEAGNRTESNEYLLTIDPTVAPAPKITSGPLGPTRNNSPTFTWQVTSSRWDYRWDVTAAGNPTVVRSGFGQGLNRATVASLPDGAYTFRVVQVINQVESASATRAFTVDTQAPAPPTITARPPFPATSPATFAWTTEPGAYSRWEVVAAGGLLAAGPSDTPLTSASIVGLAQGAYSFRVLQVDAAGNVSQWTTEPFTMIGAVLPGPPGPTASPSTTRASLPRQNARRLRPKAGKTLPTRRPVLRWTKGPRGTQLYNLQIFRVIRTKKGLTPKVRKVHSAFPRGRQYRAPMRLMLPNTCYVWRVWPYTGRRFTAKPLGVSNFCIANKKVLAKKAAAAKRKAAAKRRAAAARSARR